MADTNEYLKRYNETQNDLVKPTNLGGGDDYYKLARDQEYGLMFDKEVALENAKANAMKYTQNQINAQGFGGTGYGSSLQSGIYNTYLNKANEARTDYANNVRNINLQEQQAMQDQTNDRFESVTTMLQGADTTENMNQLLVDYGYGSINPETKEFTWNAEKPEGMSDDDWYQMQYYYRMKKNDFSTQDDPFTGAYATSEDIFRKITIPVEGGRQDTIGKAFDKEVSILFSHLNVGDVKYGDCVKMTNNVGRVIYIQYTRSGLRVCSQSDYENATNKHELVRNKQDNYSWH